MKHYILKKLSSIYKVLGFGKMDVNINFQKRILIEYYLETRLNRPKYQDPKRLNLFEYQVLSQNGEDGIIHEIFKRISTKAKYFVEFGVGNGTENNTGHLLLQGWSGAWIEGSTAYCNEIKKGYENLINNGRLNIKQAFITRDNIKSLFEELNIPGEPDLLSIDIDGNDYWIWETLRHYSPRVVVVEYNASLGPHVEWVMPYNEQHFWNGDVGHFFGASLKSFELLGRKLGYSLVACNLTGANAFFVRNDLVNAEFCEPFTSENHYEKPMYILEKQLGHRRNHKLLGSI